MDRTSCSPFWANQLRVLLTAATYVVRPAPGDPSGRGSYRHRSRAGLGVARSALEDRRPRRRIGPQNRASSAGQRQVHRRLRLRRGSARRRLIATERLEHFYCSHNSSLPKVSPQRVRLSPEDHPVSEEHQAASGSISSATFDETRPLPDFRSPADSEYADGLSCIRRAKRPVDPIPTRG